MREKAKKYAIQKHSGQTDRAGKPYIEHLKAVVAGVSTDEEKIVAWLHDVLEDTDAKISDLKELGLNDKLIHSIVLLTKTPNVSDDAYFSRIKGDKIARKVKISDLKHNSDLGRLKNPGENDEKRAKQYKERIIFLSI